VTKETKYILVVEDNPADIDLMREALPETGLVQFQIESVPRLSDAIARLAAGGIDIALTDLGLPDSQGLATFRKLHEAAPNMAIIVLTGNDDQELAVAAVREGAQDYLVKGRIGGDLLVRAIRYAIERKASEQASKQAAQALQEKIDELHQALEQIKTLRGILPICANCKKIRDDQGYWSQVEVYVRDHSEAEFSHGICPECAKLLYRRFVRDDESTPQST
jgi:DNA-binding NtrC family response regulator